jgi:hypothetical protein
MSENERIIANTNATMSMDNMHLYSEVGHEMATLNSLTLMEEDKKRIKECLEGKISFQVAVENLVKKYMSKQVM